MRNWRIVIQTTGVISIALCFWGFARLADSVTHEFMYPVQMAGAPFFRRVFLVMNCINAVLLILMIFTAVGLVRVRLNAVRSYTWLYIILVTYTFPAPTMWGNGPLGRSIAVASGVGHAGIWPLIFFPVPFVYPVLSVVLTNVAVKKLGGATDTLQPRTEQTA